MLAPHTGSAYTQLHIRIRFFRNPEVPMRTLFFLSFLMLCLTVTAQAEPRSFTLFSADLPQGWDGEEKMGFKSGNPDECMLILGLSNEKKDDYAALISIFVLPNTQNDDSASLANKLAPLAGAVLDVQRRTAQPGLSRPRRDQGQRHCGQGHYCHCSGS